MRKLTCLLLIVLSFHANAQNTDDRLKVFLECTQGWLCDMDYVKTEMTMVDFVRDRVGSDVHVMVNTQSSSSGGVQATLYFLGQGRFNNQTDTLKYFNDPTSTEDQQRKKMVQYLKLGLTRYIAKTKVADQLNIGYTGAPASGNTATTPQVDKWNYWVFSLGSSASLNGDQNYRSHSIYGNFSADRETEEWKINAGVYLNNSVDVYVQDSTESRYERESYDAELDVAKAINSHWSSGLSAGYESSLYSNIQAGYRLQGKLEYSVFPYSKFNTQRIVFQYRIGPSYSDYYDTTIYLKTKEWQFAQSINAIGSFTKPWGSVNLGIFFSNYFSDFKKNALSFNGAVSWKIAKGLQFALWGNYGLIHNQITLAKGNVPIDQILVRNRQLESSYNYNLGVGFSYRFGSIMNSIVNPRFKGLNYSINL
jgi:hypothetical protein